MKSFSGGSSPKSAGRHIIDDGSHISRQVIRSFEVLFPLLADDGLYCRTHKPPTGPTAAAATTCCTPTGMCYKSLVDGLNTGIHQAGYIPSYYTSTSSACTSTTIWSSSEGRNDEGSNHVVQSRTA
jgi:hypothetical protein